MHHAATLAIASPTKIHVTWLLPSMLSSSRYANRTMGLKNKSKTANAARQRNDRVFSIFSLELRFSTFSKRCDNACTSSGASGRSSAQQVFTRWRRGDLRHQARQIDDRHYARK